MSAVNVNEDGFSRRLAAVQNILKNFGLQSSKVTPLAYVDYAPFPFNNYIYKVDLATPALPSSFPNAQPATTPPPTAGLSTLVVRISNLKAEGLNNANRVENEVAAQYLVGESFSAAGLPPLVPAVFAWAAPKSLDATDESDYGWVVTEFKAGVDLDSKFSALETEDKRNVVAQIADAFAAFQGVKIPQAVTKYGALTVDSDGKFVTGQMPLVKGGPFDSYTDVWVAKLRAQLSDAEESGLLQGWKPNGVADRLERFLSDGVGKALSDVDIHQRVLVQGDFTTNNMLFDGATKRITAFLDFDWSSITHPSEEYLAGLADISNLNTKSPKIRSAILSGDFSSRPSDLSADEQKEWEVAQMWQDAASKRGIIRPSNIKGFESIKDLQVLHDLVCPFALGNNAMLKRLSDEQKTLKRAETEAAIIKWLEKHGF